MLKANTFDNAKSQAVEFSIATFILTLCFA